MHDAKRRLLWHGFLLVLVGLVTGAFLGSYTNPRLGLSAHVGGVMNGTLVALVGAVWGEIVLGRGAATALFWAMVGSGWANWAGLFLAAVFGTSRSTPMHGAGHAGAPWQEAVVDVLLTGGAVVILAAFVLLLIGLRAGRTAPAPLRP
jgi:hydroxylaminobenzene mutase